MKSSHELRASEWKTAALERLFINSSIRDTCATESFVSRCSRHLETTSRKHTIKSRLALDVEPSHLLDIEATEVVAYTVATALLHIIQQYTGLLVCHLCSQS